MQSTLLYFSSQKTSDQATVIDIRAKEARTALTLDQTLFHPQGGGQPTDTGFIFSDTARFVVEDVQIEDGQVLHWGYFQHGTLIPGATVNLAIDAERRQNNSRLHTAGHLVDVALGNLGYDWRPARGHHYPGEAYVSYHHDEELISPELSFQLTEELAKLIQADTPVDVAVSEGAHSSGKPLRHVTIGGKTIPCGGTHVQQLSELGSIVIRKIKNKKNVVRIAYTLA